jgi:hypothetical protein
MNCICYRPLTGGLSRSCFSSRHPAKFRTYGCCSRRFTKPRGWQPTSCSTGQQLIIAAALWPPPLMIAPKHLIGPWRLEAVPIPSLTPHCVQLGMCRHRAVRTRRFQTLSVQDIVQFVVVGLLTGCFWWQRAGHDTLAAATDTLGSLPASLPRLKCR